MLEEKIEISGFYHRRDIFCGMCAFADKWHDFVRGFFMIRKVSLRERFLECGGGIECEALRRLALKILTVEPPQFFKIKYRRTFMQIMQIEFGNHFLLCHDFPFRRRGPAEHCLVVKERLR